MTADFDYPRTTELTFSEAADELADRVDALDDDLDDTDPEEDPDRYQRLQSERGEVAAHQEGMAWAAAEFGEGASVTLQGTTTGARSRVLDTIRQATVGTPGAEQVQDWLLAASIVDAPWYDGGEDLPAKARVVDALPPAVSGYLRERQGELNGLSEGN